MLSQLPFYDESNIVQIVTTFKKYSKSYSIEIIKNNNRNMNDTLVQLEASKPVIKGLFRDLLIEMEDFKYQITLKITLSKQKVDSSVEYSTVYFNSSIKTITKINIVLINLFNKYCVELITGLMKDLLGKVNQ